MAVVIMTAAIGIGTVHGDVADYIRGVCEDYGGKWSDDNMACNDFESTTDQWNFGDALMSNHEYHSTVEECEDYGGEWSDDKAKCIEHTDDDKEDHDDNIRVNRDYNENAPCYLDGERVYPGDDFYSNCD